MTGTLLFVRHGQSTWNAERRWAGHADPPLSTAGLRAAADLAKRVEDLGLSGVSSSDQRRAFDTPQVVALGCALGDVTVDPACGSGAARHGPGSPRRRSSRRTRGCWSNGVRASSGDSERWDEFGDGVLAGLAPAAARDGRWLVVSHAGVFRVIEATLGLPARRTDNLEGRWLDVTNDGEVGGGDGLVDAGTLP